MKTQMRNRIIFDIILFVSLFYIPWWGVGVIAFMGAFTYPHYYEIIVAGIILDILYGAQSFPFSGIYNTVSSVLMLYFASYLKKSVR